MLRRCLVKSRQLAPCIQIRTYRTKGSKNKKILATIQEKSLDRPPTSKQKWTRPVTISHGSQHHEDLSSFLKHAKREGLSETSTVYIGTHYEYTVAESLTHMGFDVLRTGKTSDFGIDLLGWWRLPSSPDPIRVLLQCKAHAKKLAPQNVRELEGSFPGAPAHWRGKGVMGFLVAPSQATKGMREALIKSSLPLAFMQITREGKVLQMLWNHQATLWGLEGYGVTTRFSPKSGDMIGDVEEEVALTWNGELVGMDLSPESASAVKRRKRQTTESNSVAAVTAATPST